MTIMQYYVRDSAYQIKQKIVYSSSDPQELDQLEQRMPKGILYYGDIKRDYVNPRLDI